MVTKELLNGLKQGMLVRVTIIDESNPLADRANIHVLGRSFEMEFDHVEIRLIGEDDDDRRPVLDKKMMADPIGRILWGSGDVSQLEPEREGMVTLGFHDWLLESIEVISDAP